MKRSPFPVAIIPSDDDQPTPSRRYGRRPGMPAMTTVLGIRRMYGDEYPHVSPAVLDRRAARFARELNRLNDRTRYDDRRFAEHECPIGLVMGMAEDLTEFGLDPLHLTERYFVGDPPVAA